jgi:hypothetical protein
LNQCKFDTATPDFRRLRKKIVDKGTLFQRLGKKLDKDTVYFNEMR